MYNMIYHMMHHMYYMMYINKSLAIGQLMTFPLHLRFMMYIPISHLDHLSLPLVFLQYTLSTIYLVYYISCLLYILSTIYLVYYIPCLLYILSTINFVYHLMQ